MRHAKPLDWKRIRGLISKDPPKSNSLIVSIYGDVVWPHGGSIWIGNLIDIAGMFGIAGSTVRTATHRLVNSGWLRPYRKGRNTDYLLTSLGSQHCSEAAHRIYDTAHRHDWDGKWQAVILPTLGPVKRKEVWDELMWRGFTRIGTRVLLRPVGDDDIVSVLQSLRLKNKAVFIDKADSVSYGALGVLARENWNLSELEKKYTRFLRTFRPVVESISHNAPPDDMALALRVYMIHKYRRIMLKDPLLPRRLLPRGWHGDEAFDLCGEAYRILMKPSERYVAKNIKSEERPLPADYVALRRRFARKSRKVKQE